MSHSYWSIAPGAWKPLKENVWNCIKIPNKWLVSKDVDDSLHFSLWAVLSSLVGHFPRRRPHFLSSKIFLFFWVPEHWKKSESMWNKQQEIKKNLSKYHFYLLPHRGVKFDPPTTFTSTFKCLLSLLNSMSSIPLKSLPNSPVPLPLISLLFSGSRWC